jgi:hypothetical protein
MEKLLFILLVTFVLVVVLAITATWIIRKIPKRAPRAVPNRGSVAAPRETPEGESD